MRSLRESSPLARLALAAAFALLAASCGDGTDPVPDPAPDGEAPPVEGNGLPPDGPGPPDGEAPGPPDGQEVTVRILDPGMFEPAEVTIPVGTTVIWVQEGPDFQHTVTTDDGFFDSGPMEPGETFRWTIGEPGAYPYHCRIHGGPGTGQHGTILVVGSGAGEGE